MMVTESGFFSVVRSEDTIALKMVPLPTTFVEASTEMSFIKLPVSVSILVFSPWTSIASMTLVEAKVILLSLPMMVR
ncbi:MAG: hypothetical protein LBT59_08000, partial [Clostridiales bacterium]|nr:hypothetical protein [Clostridiales bacterium]